MADPFASSADVVSAPANRLVVVTPSDTVDLVDVPKALYIGTGGDVAIIAAGDASAVTLRNVPTGSILPVRARRVMASLTTASNVLALY